MLVNGQGALAFRKKNSRNLIETAAIFSQVTRFKLEREAHAELCLERYANRFGEAGRAVEVDRSLEIGCSNYRLKCGSEICRIEKVERFKEQPNFKSVAAET